MRLSCKIVNMMSAPPTEQARETSAIIHTAIYFVTMLAGSSELSMSTVACAYSLHAF